MYHGTELKRVFTRYSVITLYVCVGEPDRIPLLAPHARFEKKRFNRFCAGFAAETQLIDESAELVLTVRFLGDTFGSYVQRCCKRA